MFRTLRSMFFRIFGGGRSVADIIVAGEVLKQLADRFGPTLVPLLRREGVHFERVYSRARIVQLIHELQEKYPLEGKRLLRYGKRAEREGLGDRWMEFLRALVLAKVGEAILDFPTEWGKDATASSITDAQERKAGAAKKAAVEALLMVGRLKSYHQARFMMRQVENGLATLIRDLAREVPGHSRATAAKAAQKWETAKRRARDTARRMDDW